MPEGPHWLLLLDRTAKINSHQDQDLRAQKMPHQKNCGKFIGGSSLEAGVWRRGRASVMA